MKLQKKAQSDFVLAVARALARADHLLNPNLDPKFDPDKAPTETLIATLADTYARIRVDEKDQLKRLFELPRQEKYFKNKPPTELPTIPKKSISRWLITDNATEEPQQLQIKSFLYLTTATAVYLSKSQKLIDIKDELYQSCKNSLFSIFQERNHTLIDEIFKKALSDSPDAIPNSTQNNVHSKIGTSQTESENLTSLEPSELQHLEEQLTLKRILDFEQLNAGVYRLYRRHSSEGEKIILQETVVLNRAHLDSGAALTGKGKPAIFGYYIVMLPNERDPTDPEKDKFEYWELEGDLMRGNVTFRLTKSSSKDHDFAPTLMIRKLTQAPFNISVGLLTGLADDSDRLCAIPVILQRLDIKHPIAPAEMRANRRNYASIVDKESRLYAELLPLFYKTESQRGESSVNTRHGPGLLAIDCGNLRELFIKSLKAASADSVNVYR